MHFSGSRPTECPLFPPPSAKTVLKLGFYILRARQGTQVPDTSILEVLKSIMSLFLIIQALGQVKCVFQGKTDTISVYPAPPKLPPVSTAGHFKYPPSFFGDAGFNYQAN